MCLNWDFYLDILCTFFLNIYETFASGGKSSEKDNEEKLKVKILLCRVGIGYIINVGGFLVVCFTNRDTNDEGDISFFLFCFIVMYTLCFYAFITFMLVYKILVISSSDDLSLDIRFERFMMIYRCLEVIFDITVLLYSLILSGWEMTEFTIATTVLSLSDILVNCLMIVKNCCDCKKEERSSTIEENEDKKSQVCKYKLISSHSMFKNRYMYLLIMIYKCLK